MSYEIEYAPIRTLEGNAALNFRVPISIIRNKELSNIRVSMIAYLSIYRGLNSRIFFSVPLFLKWAGYKSDTHKGAINDKVIETLEGLSDLGYVAFCDDAPLTRNSCIEIEFDQKLVSELCNQQGFGILYWDEVSRIMQFRNLENPQDRHLNRNTILLVFAHLRQVIFRLSNKLKPEERSPEGIAARRERCVEAYNGNYKAIAADLGLSARTVSLAVGILEDLKLIVKAEAYHIMDGEGKYTTPDMIFANAYKRDRDKVLRDDEDYAMGEIQRKASQMKLFIPDYVLRKKQVS